MFYMSSHSKSLICFFFQEDSPKSIPENPFCFLGISPFGISEENKTKAVGFHYFNSESNHKSGQVWEHHQSNH